MAMENPLIKATKASATVTVDFTGSEFEHWTNAEGEILFRETKASFFTARHNGRIIAKRKTQDGIESAIGIWSEQERARLGVDVFITVAEEI